MKSLWYMLVGKTVCCCCGPEQDLVLGTRKQRYCLTPLSDSPAEHKAFARTIASQKSATDQHVKIQS